MREGLDSLDAVSFKQGAIGKYLSTLNTMELSADVADDAESIKPIHKIIAEGGHLSSDFDAIVHESFHAFKQNIVKNNRKYRVVRDWLKDRGQALFVTVPRHKREDALEEAYAQALGALISTKAYVDALLQKTGTGDSCSRGFEMARSTWKTTWTSKFNGYYNRDSFSEYWSDAFKGLWIRVSEGGDAYRAFKADTTVSVEDSITELDRMWISEHLLEGRLSKNFEKTFAAHLAHPDLQICMKNPS